MRLGPLILFIFIAVPIAEIWLLIEIGGLVGVFPTIALVVLTAVAGTALIRHQGMGLLNEARERLNRGEPPVGSVVDGAFLLVAGALLLTPGFITDTIGFLCLVPLFRRGAAAWMWAHYGDRIKVRHPGAASRGPAGKGDNKPGHIFEGEFTEITSPDDDDAEARPDSPWRGTPPN